MKLGLTYREQSQGSLGGMTVNGGSWDKASNLNMELSKVLRACGIAEDDTTTRGTSYKFISEGILIAIGRRINVRGNASRSFQALWIHIPAKMDVTAQEINEIINETDSIFSNPEAFISPEDFRRAIPEIFFKDFPEDLHTVNAGRMEGQELAAIRSDSTITAGQIISKGNQRAYNSYGIIAINSWGPIPEGIHEIPTRSLRQQVWIDYPKEFPFYVPKGYKLSIDIDDRPFLPPGRQMAADEHHEVKISIPGFLPISGSVYIQPSDKNHPLYLPEGEWRHKRLFKVLTLSNFKVINERNKDLTSKCKFTSPDAFGRDERPLTEFKYGDTVLIPADKLGNLRLKVTCEGYIPADVICNLLENKDVIVKLAPEEKDPVMERTFKAKNGCEVKIQVIGKDGERLFNEGFQIKRNVIGPFVNKEALLRDMQPVEENPLSRKNLVKKNSELEHELSEAGRAKKRAKRNVGLLTLFLGLVLGGLITFLCLYLWENYHEDIKEKIGTEQKGGNGIPNDSVTNVVSEAALSYLDNADVTKNHNAKWEKDQLDAFPELKGLYDDLDNFSLRQLVEVWGPKLKDSKNFSEIVKTINTYPQNKWENSGHRFNVNPDDKEIIIWNYLGKLKENPTQALPKTGRAPGANTTPAAPQPKQTKDVKP